MSFVLSIDLGTGGCRSAVYDQNLNMLHMAKSDIPLIVLSDNAVEQSAEAWWNAVCKTTREAAAPCAERIKAISISSQGISLVPVSAEGEALQNAISWLDTRPMRELEQIKERFGEKWLYRTTGKISSPLYTLPKILWMKNHRPALTQRVAKWLLPMDYVLLRLCGHAVTDPTMASGTMLYDLAACTWSHRLLKELDLAPACLPKIKDAGSAAGTLLPQVAEALGLSPDTVVAVGAQDQKCAAYAAGASHQVAAVSLGTASCITKLTDSLKFDDCTRVPYFSYIRRGIWDMEGIINTAGSALKWFRDSFAAASSFAELDLLAGEAGGPRTERFYPYLSGPSSPYWSKGTGIFDGLTLNSDLGALARSVLEGVAFTIRENVDAMDLVATETKHLCVFGGGAGSDLWCQIIADVTGRPVARPTSSDTALAGAAKLAFDSIGMESRAMLETERIFEPEPSRTAAYQAAYEAYEAAREQYYAPRERR